MWLRASLVLSFGFLAVALLSTAIGRLMEQVTWITGAELAGAVLALSLLVSSAVASCTMRVASTGVTMTFWVLFRVHLSSADVAELRADEWNSWDFGGYGLKGGRRKGWLLNASADGAGAGDKGILVRSTDGVVYRVEVHDPEKFSQRARVLLTNAPLHAPNHE